MVESTETSRCPWWVRIGAIVLGAPNALAGLWAVLTPRSWFDTFPGWDPRLVAAEPPYNAHLANDAGAGLLAAGVVLSVAAGLGDRRSMTVGLIGFATFAIPHAAYHTLHPSPGLSTAENVQNVAVLAATVLVAAVLLAGNRLIGRTR